MLGVISLRDRFKLMHLYPTVGRPGGVRGAHQVTRSRHQNRSELPALDTVRDAHAARSVLAARAPGHQQAAAAFLTAAQRSRPVGRPRSSNRINDSSTAIGHSEWCRGQSED